MLASGVSCRYCDEWLLRQTDLGPNQKPQVVHKSPIGRFLPEMGHFTSLILSFLTCEMEAGTSSPKS